MTNNPNKIKEVLEKQMESFDEKFVKKWDGCLVTNDKYTMNKIRSHIQNSNQEINRTILEEIGDIETANPKYQMDILKQRLKEALQDDEEKLELNEKQRQGLKNLADYKQ